MGLGLFVGCLPLYGFHLPLCLLICLPLGLDAVVAYVAANISNPFVAPFLLLAEVEIGSLILHGHSLAFDLAAARSAKWQGLALEVGLGSVVLGSALACVGGGIAFLVARRRSRPSALAEARQRTVARYARARPADRYYVAAKLGTDPALAQLVELGPLGDVVDAGCGRGQLGLCLLELGHVNTLRGFDFDARKVEVARQAAGSAASFSVGDLRSTPLTDADTVLLIDVLHYLEIREQTALLARASAALRVGGRLVVREVDAAAERGSRLTRGLERLATALGYNRSASRLGFRALSELVGELEAAGLECAVVEESPGATLANRMIAARRVS